MLANENFVHTHLHTDRGSNVRLKDSIAKIEDILLYANELGNKGVAITDHESLTAHVKAINTLNELKQNKKISDDFKLLLGNEIYLVSQKDMEVEGKKTFYHFILIAKDSIGHEQLRKLSSRAWKDNFFNYKGMQRVPTYYSDIEEIIGEDKGHIIAQTACLGSLLGHYSQMIDETEDENLIELYKDKMADFIEWCIDIFGEEDFYLEMQPNMCLNQINYNELIISIAKAYNLKTTITTDVHFVREADRRAHKAFLTSEDKDANREVDDFYETTRFFDTKEIYASMNYLDENTIDDSIANTLEIMNKCIVGENNDYGLFKPIKIPLTPLPPQNEWYPVNKELINKYENIKNIYEDEYIYHTYLIHLIFEGLDKRNISKTNYKRYFERINIELEEIYCLSVAMKEPIGAYLTTMKDNLDIMWQTTIIGVGRGSSVCYLTDYLLEITDIDPLTMEDMGMSLPHWRFIHKSKLEMPDVDTDYSSNLKNEVFFNTRNYYRSFDGDMIRIITFKTETSKSAISTACRGLGINNDIYQYISSLIPIERGKVWSISDTYYGNPKKNRKAVKEFVDIIDKYSDLNLLENIFKIEGLVSGIGSHASGVLPINKNIEYYSSIMRTPSGELVTSFDLHEIEKCGAIKYDFLLTTGMAIIQLTIELLCKYGFMKWQGNLKDTYKKYLSPSVIDLEDKEVWNNIKQNKVMNLFQFGETPVGREAIKKLQPNNLIDMANANALMRLMSDSGDEQPLDKYIKFKNNPHLWEEEMIQYGLSEEDRKILHELLDDQCGVCSNQESMMEMFMDKRVADYGVKEVNLIKKGIAKKIEAIQKEAEKLLISRQQEIGTSKRLVDYCWNVQTSYQKGYAFSKPHCVAYSVIGYQEAYLYTKYPPIFWYVANLIAMTDSFEETEEEYEFDFDIKDKPTKYGKVAKAISDIQNQGVIVDFPDINKSELGFIPNLDNNSILFGLKGITGINEDTCQTIIENRPYNNMKDFYNRLVATKRQVELSTGKTQMKSYVTNKQMENLIKSGSFDKIEKKPREEILIDFIKIINPAKSKMSAKDIEEMDTRGIVPIEFNTEIKYINFRKFLTTLPKQKDENVKAITWYKIDCGEDTDYTTEFFLNNFANDMEEDRDYYYDEDGLINVALGTKRKGSFDNIYSNKIEPLSNWLETEDCISYYNKIKLDEKKKEYMQGGISKWEMDSISYYYHEHELTNVNKIKYEISNFFEMPEQPNIEGYNEFINKSTKEVVRYPIYKLTNIVGTILDKDKNKHTVTILTPEGVTNIKFYAGQFSFYDKNISVDGEVDPKTGKSKKVTLEEGWFKKGNLIFVTGFRRNDNFYPKRYKNSIYQHTVQLIKEIKDNGDMIFQSDRTRIDN
ncbi:PHP domain-containing protein [Clostridium beijerinckii]|uniref:PHP domain-containing protein n=1 Tax=Clostridium beijerinckii TaxID=1520 RepID=UPI001570377B|nr:PHP domain-containing protein [Clostridium beijerinckii]NRU52656.1 DNA polymerase-3 subunit alpha [Clostridium beijerinckii]NYC68699.1 DNA polymerase-3 subunit alpha [Clostridium beijerinckii]NYC91848.1 DNA polymerase-3 subunit alpha [Clostridium beijerinckii]